jgi:hypothetical protein
MQDATIRTAVGLAALVGLVTVPLPEHFASAACAPSDIEFKDGRTQPLLVPGETVTLTDTGFVLGGQRHRASRRRLYPRAAFRRPVLRSLRPHMPPIERAFLPM